MDDNDILKSYNETQSSYETAKQLGIDRNKVYRTLRRLEVSTKGISGPKQKNKIKVDESYFGTIDSSEKAYWLGFLAADGSVVKQKSGSYSLSLTLAIKDESHLQDFKLALQSAHKIERINRQHPAVRIGIVRKKLTDSLFHLGIVPRKTYEPFFIPENHTQHWLRGLVDGDGSFWVRTRANRKPQLCFGLAYSNEEQGIQIKQLLESLGVTGGTFSKSGNYGYHLSYEGNNLVGQIADIIYDNDQGLCLARKKTLAYSVLNAHRKNNNDKRRRTKLAQV